MNRSKKMREEKIRELAKKNRWYEYEKYKKDLSLQGEAEVRNLTKDLRV